MHPETLQLLQSIGSLRPAGAAMNLATDALPHAALTFANCGEDMLLRKILKEQVVAGKGGTYVDIGCAAPISMSNTYLFYCLGWRGLCIDANDVAAPYWAEARPEDKFVRAAVGEREGETYFFRHKTNLGMHMISPSPDPIGDEFAAKPDVVPMRRLDRLLAEHIGDQRIDLLSIDIEGAEVPALKSNDWRRWRPEVIIAECALRFEAPFASETVAFLTAQGYRLAEKIRGNVIMIDGRAA